MKILGLAAPFGHDASAALMIDGEVAVAVEEERFTRKKHAEGQLPVNAIQFCLKQANLKPADIDVIAFPWAIEPSMLKEKAAEILDSEHHAPFMTIAFKMNPDWAKKVPEVVHVDGTCRPQGVDKESNPLYYKLINYFY